MSMSIADHLRSYSQAYPIDIFPECDREKLKQLHIDYPNMSARIFAESGRTFARQALEGANELDRQEQEIEKLKEGRLILVDLLEILETELALLGSETEVYAHQIRETLKKVKL